MRRDNTTMGTSVVETQSLEAGIGESRPERIITRQAFEQRLKRRTATRLPFVATNALALLASNKAAEALVQRFVRIPAQLPSPRGYELSYLPFLLAILYFFERNRSRDLRPERELELVVKSVSFAFLLLVCADFAVFKTGFSGYQVVSWYVLTLVSVLMVRFGLQLSYGWLWAHGIGRRKTLLVGSTTKLFELQTLLSIQRYRGYELLGIVQAGDDSLKGRDDNPLPVLGALDQWYETVRESGAEQVILSLPENTLDGNRLTSNVLKRCLADGIEVQLPAELFASREFNYEFDEFSGFFRFYPVARWPKRVQRAAKAILDLGAGSLGSLVTLLVTPVVGLLIKLEDGGPIFYRSPYVGPNGEDRYYLKFRTMRVGADRMLERDPELRKQFEASCKLRQDPRVTRVGRFLRKYSVDEFPSSFSILRGHISLVGPRTIMQMQKEKYGRALPKLLSVKPGLTGFWQVMGRQLTTHDERVRMDMFYIDHWSIWLDLWIVAKTFRAVLRAEGAY